MNSTVCMERAQTRTKTVLGLNANNSRLWFEGNKHSEVEAGHSVNEIAPRSKIVKNRTATFDSPAEKYQLPCGTFR